MREDDTTLTTWPSSGELTPSDGGALRNPFVDAPASDAAEKDDTAAADEIGSGSEPVDQNSQAELLEAPDLSSQHPEGATADRPEPAEHQRLLANEQPVSARTALALPTRLTKLHRVRASLPAAFEDRGAAGPPSRRAWDPDAFARATPTSLVQRLREAWARTGYEWQLEERIVAPRLTRCAMVAVISPKGGPGKTTITALLGSLLALLRRDRIVAVDANPDFGTLGRRLVPRHPLFIDDLLAGLLKHDRLSATELDAGLGRGPNGLMVAPAPTDPTRAKQLDEAAYRTLFGRLGALAGTLVLDCGTGLDAPPARAALGCADQLVLVTDGEPETASLVFEAAQWLEQCAAPLVLVVNKLARGSRLDVQALERRIPFARGLVRVPHDRSGADRLSCGDFGWTRAPRGWRAPLRELAALLVADWGRLGLAR